MAEAEPVWSLELVFRRTDKPLAGISRANLSSGAADARALETTTRRLEQLPGPRGLPFVGSLLQLDAQRLHLVLEDWARAHGSLYAFRAGPKRTLVVSDPSQYEEILRARPHDFRRISRVETVLSELGIPGVFSAEGAAWRPQRNLLTQALSVRRLANFHPTLCSIAQRLERRWRAAAASGATLDVLGEFKRLSVDVTTRLAFGHDANTIEHDGDELQRQLQLLFPTVNRRLTAAVPYWRVLRMPADRRVDRNIRELQARLRTLLAAARRRLAQDPARAEAPADLLEAMSLATDETGQPFSDELILGNAVQVLVAGEDTTAATLAWAVHLLCEHPAVVTELRMEFERVLGGASLPADPGAAGRLSHVNAILQETSRLRSVAPLIFLESNADLRMAGVAVPRGTWIIVLTRLAAMSSPSIAGPTEFRPERWLAGATGEESPQAGIPFGSGARICPGRALALLEMRVALALLYRNFDVERVGTSETVGERFAFIVEPVGLRVKLRQRDLAPV